MERSMYGLGAAFSESGFWAKLRQQARRAGRQVVESALQLYYAAQSPSTPKWAKTVVHGALAYFILPADVVPDLLPGVGYTDDLGVLAMALATIAMQITPEIRERARRRAQEWLGAG